MKKKKLLTIVTIAAVALVSVGCLKQRIETNNKVADVKPLRVATQNYFISSSVGYMVDHNIDEQFGLDIEIVPYATGAEQLADIEKDKYDVVTIGAAFLEPLAQNQAVVIGEMIRVEGGNGVYAKSDSPVFDVKGFNPTYPDVYGNFGTLEGCSILLKKDTIQQYLAMKWLESVGVRRENVNFIYENGDFNKLYERFVEGTGDIALLCAPNSYECEKDGYKKVADTESLHMDIYEVVLATMDAHTEKEEEITAFLECLLYTNEILESDMSKKIDAAQSWYEASGQKVNRKILKQECKDKHFVTKVNYNINEYGEFENKYAEYMAAIGNISPLVLDNVSKNIDGNLFNIAMGRVKSR